MSNPIDRPRPRQLRVDDLTAIVDLQRVVYPGLPPRFVRPKSTQEMAGYLDGARGVAYGIDGDDGLSAVALLRLPSEAQPNTAMPFPLVPSADWPYHACLLESALVDPAARGRGLQRTLLDARIAHAAAVGMRWICAGVHLRNEVSWTNLLRKGMVVTGIQFDADQPFLGLLRSATIVIGTPTDTSIDVDAGDTAAHLAALERGFVGVGCTDDGRVIYRPRPTCPRQAIDGAPLEAMQRADR